VEIKIFGPPPVGQRFNSLKGHGTSCTGRRFNPNILSVLSVSIQLGCSREPEPVFQPAAELSP